MSVKKIKNTICGKSNCSRDAETRVIFQLGFSAGFCTKCADDIMEQGLGIRDADLKNELVLDAVGGPVANTRGSPRNRFTAGFSFAIF
jgi:hypothetical protein